MLDLTKPMCVKGGGGVEIITTNGHAPYPIVGYFTGDYTPRCWGLDGTYGLEKDQYEQTLDPDEFNIINTPEPKRSGVVCFAVCDNGDVVLCNSATPYSLIGITGKNVLAIKRIPWTEGEGLEGK